MRPIASCFAGSVALARLSKANMMGDRPLDAIGKAEQRHQRYRWHTIKTHLIGILALFACL